MDDQGNNNGLYARRPSDGWRAVDPDGWRSRGTERGGLYAQENSDGWHVVDPEGGVWWPRDEVASEIRRNPNPRVHIMNICLTQPLRGDWRS